MSASDRIRVAARKRKARTSPLWLGPCSDGPNGGITFSLLSRFLACRERFRLLVTEGLRPADGFNPRLEFGNMWHVCEEAHAGGAGAAPWEERLKDYAKTLCERYPLSRADIDNWYGICRTEFPLYVAHWGTSTKGRKPLLQEHAFAVPYPLPSGRVVVLRGKWDSVDLVTKGRKGAIVLQENKTKGDIDEGKIRRQLTFDLQTMMYIVALLEYQKVGGNGSKSSKWSDGQHPIQGVRYNVVRRPRHYQGKKETPQEFLDRLRGIIEEDPGHFFMRWDVEVTKADVERFKVRCLNPVLEHLCDWWGWICNCAKVGVDPFVPSFHNDSPSLHWQHPFGVFNPLDEGGSSDLDEYILSGSEVGLNRVDNLFPELST